MFGSRLLAPSSSHIVEREQVSVTFADGGTLDIARVRDPRAKRIKLSVDERGVRLTLPLRASLLSGDRFIHQHRDWLQQQLQRFHQGAPRLSLVRDQTAQLPLRGENLALRWTQGRYLRLQVHEQNSTREIEFQVSASERDAGLHRALRDFYEAQARADIGRWLPKYLPTLPRAPARIQLKVMSSQWGSLSPTDSLALDLSLVLGRPSAFEYVLVHELCHLIHANHSRAFWREVEHHFPTWRDERQYFQTHGGVLKAQMRNLLGA